MCTHRTVPENKYSLLPLEKQGLSPTFFNFVIYAHVLCKQVYVNQENRGLCS